MEQWVFSQEIEGVHPVKDAARRRAEDRGLFPRRVRLSPHKVAWRRIEVDAWQRDPAGWADRRQAEQTKATASGTSTACETSEDLRELL